MLATWFRQTSSGLNLSSKIRYWKVLLHRWIFPKRRRKKVEKRSKKHQRSIL